MTKLIQKTGAGTGRVLFLKAGKWRLGRNPTNDFPLDDPAVSSFHGELTVAEIATSYLDLGSTNGSYLDGQPFARGVLGHGQVLRLGGIEFLVEAPLSAIAIPKPAVVEQKKPNFLPDGSPACQVHSEISAIHRCVKCEEVHCDECVRRTGLTGGRFLVFCPTCSGKCEPLVVENIVRKKSFLVRLGDTLHLTRPKAR